MPAASAVNKTRHPRWERCRALPSALPLSGGDNQARDLHDAGVRRDRQHQGERDDYAVETAGRRSAVGEWVRDASSRPPPPSGQPRPIARSWELLALRKILLNLQFSVAVGEPVTRDRMLDLIEEADAEKGERARARLTAGTVG